jgi:hypothetical protein
VLEVVLAERGGFEPPIRLPVCRISSAVLSTTQPPLRSRRVLVEGGACVARGRRGRQAASRPQCGLHPSGSGRANAIDFRSLGGLFRPDCPALVPVRPPVPSVDKRSLAAYESRLTRGRNGPARIVLASHLGVQAFRHASLKPDCQEAGPWRHCPRAGMNTEQNDVRSDQDRRQAIPRRRR